MFPSYLPQQSCDLILQQIRTSHLNFAIQETPYSIFLTIRKSFTKSFQNHVLQNQADPNSEKVSELKSDLENLLDENKSLVTKIEVLEASKISLSKTYEEEVAGSETLKIELNDTTVRVKNLHTNFQAIETKLKNVEIEKKKLETKHEKTCAEVKSIRYQKDDLLKENDKNKR